MFEITLGDLASLVGLRYPLPADRRRSRPLVSLDLANDVDMPLGTF